MAGFLGFQTEAAKRRKEFELFTAPMLSLRAEPTRAEDTVAHWKRPDTFRQFLHYVDLFPDFLDRTLKPDVDGVASFAVLASFIPNLGTLVPQELFFTLAMRTLANCRPADLGPARGYVSEVVRVVAMMTTEMGQSTAFIRVMERMLGSRAAPPATLTPIHVYLLRAYILGDFMRPARELLRRSVLEVDPLGTTLTSEEFLLYFLYAARVHATLSDWRACLDALRACITFPALITSAIQVDAYKMFVLVSLIHTGSVPDLPTSTSPIVARTIARLAGPAVADVRVAFADARSSDALVAALTAHREALVRDGLFGLSEHLSGSWLRHRISRLTNTFVTLTLREIAEICGLRSAADAEAELLRMMEEGRIEAVIDAREGRVSFGGDADAHGFDDIATMRRLESLLGKTAALAAGISRVEESLVRDVKYHAGAAHSSSRRDEGLPTEFAGAGGHFGPGSADGDD